LDRRKLKGLRRKTGLSRGKIWVRRGERKRVRTRKTTYQD